MPKQIILKSEGLSNEVAPFGRVQKAVLPRINWNVWDFYSALTSIDDGSRIDYRSLLPNIHLLLHPLADVGEPQAWDIAQCSSQITRDILGFLGQAQYHLKNKIGTQCFTAQEDDARKRLQ
jgi:hypothetical protein